MYNKITIEAEIVNSKDTTLKMTKILLRDNVMKKILPGFRIIKTVIAVAICLIAGKMLHYGFPFYACLSAILMMKENADLSLKFGIYRCIGTLFGGCFGILSLFIAIYFNIHIDSWIYIALMSVNLLLALSVGRILAMPEYAMSMTAILFVIIMCNYNASLDASIHYAFMRIAETILGIVVAVGVNILIKPNTTTPAKLQ